MFAIFLCMAIGHVFGDLQRIEIGKDDLKAIEDAREDLPHYVKEAINHDQYLQSKDNQVPTQSVNSIEPKTDEKLSSLVQEPPLTFGAYEARNSGQKVYFETREEDIIRSLLKYANRNTSSKKDSMMFRSFPVKSAAFRYYTDKDLSIKMKSFRRKRDAFDSLNDLLEPVFGVLHPKAKQHRVKHHRHKVHNNIDYTKKEKLLDVDTSHQQETNPMIISRSGSPKISAASYSAMQYLLNKLPDVLKSKILITDDAEKVVLENYVKSQSVPTEALDAYSSAKKDERELLKRLLREIPIILSTYKALRKGVAWNYTRFDNKFMTFFQQPSDALKQYEALKSDEFSSLDSFLASPATADKAKKHKHEGKGKHAAVAKTSKPKKAKEKSKDEESNNQNEIAEKGKVGEATKENLSLGEEPAEDIEELETEIRQVAELEPKTKGEEAAMQNLQGPNVAAPIGPGVPNGPAKAEAATIAVKPQSVESAKPAVAAVNAAGQMPVNKAIGGGEESKKLETKGGVADAKLEEQAVKAEAEKAEVLKLQENQSADMERREPYCGALTVELNENEKQEILKAHNNARRKEHSSNMLQLTWDNELAIIAQYKANTCGYFHSMYTDCKNDTLGQNLFTNFMASVNAAYPPINYTHVIGNWAGERVYWNWAKSSCLDGKICTHWKTVTGAKARRLGCGKSECPELNVKEKLHKMANFVVCNYGPFSMDFERGERCSSCYNSTIGLDEKGFHCRDELCDSCEPKKSPNCQCGPAIECQNNGTYSAETCGCICQPQHYGTYCEMLCNCEDIDVPMCEKHASECNSTKQKSWIRITCQKTCNTCSVFPRPASCNSGNVTLQAQVPQPVSTANQTLQAQAPQPVPTANETLQAQAPQPVSTVNQTVPLQAPKPVSTVNQAFPPQAQAPKPVSTVNQAFPPQAQAPQPVSAVNQAFPPQAQAPQPVSSVNQTVPVQAQAPQPVSTVNQTVPLQAQAPQPVSAVNQAFPPQAQAPQSVSSVNRTLV